MPATPADRRTRDEGSVKPRTSTDQARARERPVTWGGSDWRESRLGVSERNVPSQACPYSPRGVVGAVHASEQSPRRGTLSTGEDQRHSLSLT